MTYKRTVAAIALCASLVGNQDVRAQTETNLAVLKGLAPLTILRNTIAGRAALAANLSVAGGIQIGAIHQPSLLPPDDQRQQALKDAFITDENLAQLADGLDSTLGSAYAAKAHYKDRERFTSISSAVADLIAYTNATTRDDSNSAKYFFANAPTDGKAPVSEQATVQAVYRGLIDI